MSKLVKLSIQGIRSFSDESPSYIEFSSPLTIISGDNGTGKTTIIESLKYIFTGTFPENNKSGINFIIDKNLVNKSEISGSIKLQLITNKNKNLLATKIIKVKYRNNIANFRTMEQTLTTKGDNGQKHTINEKCIDFQNIMPELLGVNKSLINNIIFCPQEYSLWPFFDHSTLKKIFDDLLDTTIYNKRIEELKLVKKQQEKDKKNLIIQKEYILKDYNNFKNYFKSIKNKEQEKIEKVNIYEEIEQNIIILKNDKKNIEEYIEDLKNNISNEKYNIKDYQNKISLLKNKIFYFKDNYLNIDVNILKKDIIKKIDKYSSDIINKKKYLETIENNLNNKGFIEYNQNKEILNKKIELFKISSNKLTDIINIDRFNLDNKDLKTIILNKIKIYYTNFEENEVLNKKKIEDLDDTVKILTKKKQKLKNKLEKIINEKLTYEEYKSLIQEEINIKSSISSLENDILKAKSKKRSSFEKWNEINYYINKIQCENKEYDNKIKYLHNIEIKFQIKNNFKKLYNKVDNKSLQEILKLFLKEKNNISEIIKKKLENENKLKYFMNKNNEKWSKYKSKLNLINDKLWFYNDIDINRLKEINKKIDIINNLKENDLKMVLNQIIQFSLAKKQCIICENSLNKSLNIEHIINNNHLIYENENKEFILNYKSKLDKKLDLISEKNKLLDKIDNIKIKNKNNLSEIDIWNINKFKNDLITFDNDINIIEKNINLEKSSINIQDFNQSIHNELVILFENNTNLLNEYKEKMNINKIKEDEQNSLYNKLINKNQEIENQFNIKLESKNSKLSKHEDIKNSISRYSNVDIDFLKQKKYNIDEKNLLKIEIKNKSSYLEQLKNTKIENNIIIKKNKEIIDDLYDKICEVLLEIHNLKLILKNHKDFDMIENYNELKTQKERTNLEIIQLNKQIEVENYKIEEILNINELKIIDFTLNKSYDKLKLLKNNLTEKNNKLELIELDSQLSKLYGLKGEIKILHKFQNETKENIKSKKNLIDDLKTIIIKIKLKSIAIDEINLVIKSLEDSLINYHNLMINDINNKLKELWKVNYHGKDISTVKIIAEKIKGEKMNNNFDYKIIFKNFNKKKFDMKNKSSAGQKMMASIIIRLALSEKFCQGCGILSLDEPTTNLDKNNVDNLTNFIKDLIAYKSTEMNLQLIIITHDDYFLQKIENLANNTIKLKKNDKGFSYVVKS